MYKSLFLVAVMGLLVAGSASAGDMKMDSDMTPKNTELVKSFYNDVFNAHNVDAISQYCSVDFVDHNPDPGQQPGLDGLKAAFTSLFAAFPDLKVEVLKTVAEGDTVVAHITLSGTQQGEYMGMPASGKAFNIGGMDMVTIKDGKATDRWGYVDAMSMMAQLAPEKDDTMQK